MTWERALLDAVLQGCPPLHLIDNGIVTSDRLTVGGVSRPITLYAGVRYDVDAILPELTESDPDLIDTGGTFRAVTTAAATLASATPPAALATAQLALGTGGGGTASVVSLPVTSGDYAEPTSMRRAAGLLISVSPVAPDTTAGGFPGQPGSVNFRLTYGHPTLGNSSYTRAVSAKVMTCSYNATSLFLSFINPGPYFDTPFMPQVPAYNMFSNVNMLGNFVVTLDAVSSYNMPTLRLNAELVLVSSLLARQCQPLPTVFKAGRDRGSPALPPAPGSASAPPAPAAQAASPAMSTHDCNTSDCSCNARRRR